MAMPTSLAEVNRKNLPHASLKKHCWQLPKSLYKSKNKCWRIYLANGRVTKNKLMIYLLSVYKCSACFVVILNFIWAFPAGRRGGLSKRKAFGCYHFPSLTQIPLTIY